MKNLLLLTVAFFCFTVAQAANDWKLYFSNESIEIYYTYTDCHDEANGLHQQKILYRIVNKTNSNVEVSFSKTLYYDNSKPFTSETLNTAVVNKWDAVEGDCSNRNTALYTFIKQLDIPSKELKKCELNNITVKPIE